MTDTVVVQLEARECRLVASVFRWFSETPESHDWAISIPFERLGWMVEQLEAGADPARAAAPAWALARRDAEDYWRLLH